MKFLFLLSSLFAAVLAQSIGAPAAGATLVPGQNFTLQILEGVDTVRLNFALLDDVIHLLARTSRVTRQVNWKSASSSASHHATRPAAPRLPRT